MARADSSWSAPEQCTARSPHRFRIFPKPTRERLILACPRVRMARARGPPRPYVLFTPHPGAWSARLPGPSRLSDLICPSIKALLSETLFAALSLRNRSPFVGIRARYDRTSMPRIWQSGCGLSFLALRLSDPTMWVRIKPSVLVSWPRKSPLYCAPVCRSKSHRVPGRVRQGVDTSRILSVPPKSWVYVKQFSCATPSAELLSGTAGGTAALYNPKGQSSETH
jgi:hypothetical protein